MNLESAAAALGATIKGIRITHANFGEVLLNFPADGYPAPVTVESNRLRSLYSSPEVGEFRVKILRLLKIGDKNGCGTIRRSGWLTRLVRATQVGKLTWNLNYGTSRPVAPALRR